MRPRSNKVIALAFNYKDLRKNEKTYYEFPALFLKSPTSIIHDGDNILIPPAAQGKTWAEVELAIKIGQNIFNPIVRWGGRAVTTIEGFGIANNVSAFNINDMDVHLAFSKALNTFCPLSKEFLNLSLKEVENLRMTMTINGKTMQDGNTKNMFFKPIKALEFISSYITLYPGDIVLTGTPKHDKTILQDGDEVTVAIEKLGSITNKVKYINFDEEHRVIHN